MTSIVKWTAGLWAATMVLGFPGFWITEGLGEALVFGGIAVPISATVAFFLAMLHEMNGGRPK